MSLDRSAQSWEVESVLDNYLSGAVDPEEPFTVIFPGTSKEVGLRTLNDNILKQCDIEVRKIAEKEGIPYSITRSLDSEYAAMYAAEVVAKALCDPHNSGISICSCGAELSNKTRRENITWLFRQWIEHTSKFAPPEPNVLTKEQYEKLELALKKKESKTLLQEYGVDSLRNFILFLVGRLKTYTG